jgi:hypothetical protein
MQTMHAFLRQNMVMQGPAQSSVVELGCPCSFFSPGTHARREAELNDLEGPCYC